jgi:hypothetical protein
MVGIPELVLHVAVSAPDADILAFLMEYDGTSPPEDSFAYEAWGVRGRYRNGLDDPSPLTPNEPFEVAIPFYPMANRFEAGSRIGLVIAASMCGLSENPHTGEPIESQTHWEAATYRLFHDTDHPSRLILPVLRSTPARCVYGNCVYLPLVLKGT